MATPNSNQGISGQSNNKSQETEARHARGEFNNSFEKSQHMRAEKNAEQSRKANSWMSGDGYKDPKADGNS